jgi:hypothetical protein
MACKNKSIGILANYVTGYDRLSYKFSRRVSDNRWLVTADKKNLQTTARKVQRFLKQKSTKKPFFSSLTETAFFCLPSPTEYLGT